MLKSLKHDKMKPQINTRLSFIFVPFVFFLVISRLSALTGFASFKIGVSPREVAMGGAGVASGTGPTAIYWNPALSSFNTSDFGLNISYARFFTDMSHQSLFLTQTTKPINLGFGIVNFNYGKVEYREDRPTDDPIGYFTPMDFALFLNLSRSLDPTTSLGISGKLYYSKLFDEVAQGIGADIGLLFKPKPNIKLGISVINFGQTLRFFREKVWLPTEGKVGFGYELLKFLKVAGDFSYLFYTQDFRLNFGSEINLGKAIFLRFGLSPFTQANQYSLGFGIARKDFRFEYAFSPYNYNFGSVHRFGLGIGY